MSGNLRSDVTIPLDIRCSCARPRRIPVSLDAEFWAMINLLLANVDVDPNQRVLVAFCRHCSTKRDVLVSDLRLDNGKGLHHMLGVKLQGTPDVGGSSSG